MTENFNILVNKLNSFKSKYYSYKLMKGLIITLFTLLVVFTVFSVVEYTFYLSAEIRKVVFYSFLIFSLLLVVQFIAIPLLKLLQVLKPINLKTTTFLIQKHFTEIEDKLLNIIELANSKEDQYSNEIVLASIDQKINDLRVFDFNEAVQFKNIKLVSIYLIFSILISSGILIIDKNIFAESTHRLVHYNSTFIKPAPFQFELKNDNLKAKKGDSFIIKVEAEGDEIPQIVYINIEGNNYLMKTTKPGNFEFEMASVINPVQFHFTDLKYSSSIYKLELLPKPGITGFVTKIETPKYTGLKNEMYENIGDLQVPNGTKIEWNFSGIDIDSLYIHLSDSNQIGAKEENKSFIANNTFYKSTDYDVFIKNIITKPELALSYSIEVIPDLFPEINVTQVEDSLQLTRFFFKGIIGDDYGFSNLRFHYNVDNNDSTVSIPFIKNLNDQEFYFSFDFNSLEKKEGTISYYFSVTDNDIINNYKTTTSYNFIFEFPDRQEVLANEKAKFDAIQNQVTESRKLAKEIQEDLKNLQIKNMDTNVSEWEKSQMVNDIVSKQNKLEQLYNQIKQENENLNNYMNSFNKQNQELVEKQKQIEELLDEVFTDELKNLMEEFNKLAEEFDSKKLNQLSDKMNLTYEDLQKQLDRNLEMLRKMKVEQKIQDVIDRISELAKEEITLANKVIKEKNYAKTRESTEEHQNVIRELQKQINEALELNNELQKPLNFDAFEDDFEDVYQSLAEILKELDKKNRKRAGANLKNTSEKLQNMQFSMQQMLDSNTIEQNLENIDNLKQILSNLILLSFTQENILADLQGINSKDPLLVQLNKDQKKIVDQSQIVKDSLYALAMRTPQITSMVNNELLSMELHLKKATEEMEEALFPNARVSQQFVITATNNLALMLNEALENIEKQMANAQPGDQQCENPGNGQSGMNSLKESAESMKQQLEKMIEQMKNGQGKNMSQQLGESLMQHEMMQQVLRELMNNGSVGSGAKKQLQQIDRLLEQNRKELMSKSIDAQTVARQNLITTRLLEAEKSEREREFENKRESESAEEFYSNPVKFFEYKEKENFTIEYLNKNSHKLNNFYTNKYKKYLNNIDNNSE